MTDLKKMIERTASRLRPLPAAAVRLSAVVARNDFEIDEAVGVIASDVVLASDVLRLANSASSGAIQRIGNVREAVIRLGASRILQWMLGRQVMSEMERPVEAYSLDERELWRHSLATALAAERIRGIAGVAGIEISPIVYSAALLHDIGKLMLAPEFTPARKDEIIRLTNDGRPYIEAEAEVCGITHADAGAGLLRAWNLPEQLCRAVEMHHRPDETPEPMTDAVHVANLVVKTIGIGMGSEGLGITASADAAVRLKLSPACYEITALYVLSELDRFESVIAGTEKRG